MKEQGAERVTLYRDEKNLYINGVRFPMRRLKRGEQQQLWLGNMTLTDRDYETELETAHDRIEKLVKDLSENIFISEEDKKGWHNMWRPFVKRLHGHVWMSVN